MKSKEEIEQQFNEIINDISINGLSLRKALINRMSDNFFYELIDSDSEKKRQYARACNLREELIFDEIKEISDNQSNDVIETEDGIQVNYNIIQRNKLQIDSRKWILSKMNPKKYGDKIDFSGDMKITKIGKDLEDEIKEKYVD